ncbi:GDSL-type esterase/lipase family protein [Streptomyces sp. NPDC008150]|uniref:SGNH/GDSL hydrolase family protein n=1 Tax=Streptomyces sp. NPDC008150 TaxID=3364816 RepID=UPI0036E3FED1
MNSPGARTAAPSPARPVARGLAAAAAGALLTFAAAVPADAHDAHAAHQDHHSHKGHGHAPGTYVALGDSYAAGPGIPDQVDANCARSDHNYASLVAAERHLPLKDVTCSGATTAEMTGPQGTAPAQFTALNSRTALVTLSIGGNDIGFSTILGTCAHLTAADPAGAPCRAYYNATGTDQLRAAVNTTAPKIAAVLRGIHHRAPHAKVMVVGYPDLLPDDGVGCTSASVPFAAGDFAYLRDTEKALNAMLAKQAARGGARYVDTYRPTVGHDMCKPVGQRWIESLQPASPAAPAHPNAAGERAMATAVEHALPVGGKRH